MSLTRNAASFGTGCFATGAFTGVAVLALEEVDFDAGGVVASGTYKPARTHFWVASSYLDQPPLVREAHQPVGAAYTWRISVRFNPGPSVLQVVPPSLVARKALSSKVSTTNARSGCSRSTATSERCW